MKTYLTLITLILGASPTLAQENTFGTILGAPTVKKIVNRAVVDVMAGKDEKHRRIVVEPALYEEIVLRAGETKLTITVGDSEKLLIVRRLKEGVTGFLKDYRDFVAEREKNIDVLILPLEGLDDFVGWFKKQKRCGKIPCDIPPCCGDCDGCDGKK
jgi:hypothetical protein